MPVISALAEQDRTVTGASRRSTGSCRPSSRRDRTTCVLMTGAGRRAVCFPAREDGRIDDVPEPQLGADETVQLLLRPSCGPVAHVPDKQIHRWLNDGGAVLPHD